MVLKDWKKVEKDYWERPSIKKNIFRGKIGTDKLGITKAYNENKEKYIDYKVIMMISGGGIKESKSFKTKIQAQAFAKSYMRKH